VVTLVPTLSADIGSSQTLFSTSFFDFQSAKQNLPIMSQWFWLYWLVTASLTFFVLATWLYITHRETLKTNERLRVKRDNEKRIDQGSTVKREQRRVDERFDAGDDDVKTLDHFLTLLTSRNVSSTVPSNSPTPEPSTISPVLSDKGPPVPSNETTPSPSNAVPTPLVGTKSAVNNSTAPVVLNTAANQNLSGSLGYTTLQRTLTEEAGARLQELRRREQEDKARRLQEQQESVVRFEIARRQPPRPPRVSGM
jgi:hypothetical protein